MGLFILLILFILPTVGEASAQTNHVEIGALLTTSQSNMDRLEGMRLGVADFNAANPDYQLSITPFQLGDDPEAALRAAYDNGNGPKYYIGPTGSANVEKVREFADVNNIIIVSPSSTAARLAIEGDSTFRLAPSDAKQAPFIGDLLKSDEKTYIVTVYRNDTWGRGLAEGIPASYRDAVFVSVPFEPDAANHMQTAGDLKAALDASTALDMQTAVLYLGFESDIIKTFEAVDGDPSLASVLAVRWYGADGIANKPIIADHAVAGRLANTVDLTATIFFISEGDLTKSVKARLTDRVRGELNQYIYTSYDSARLIGETIKAVGADDPALVRAGFIQAAADYVGALGDYNLDDAGDLVEPSAFTAYRVVNDGQGSYVWDRFLLAEIRIGMLLLLNPDEYNDFDLQDTMILAADEFNDELARLGSGYKTTVVPVRIDVDPVAAITDAHINQGLKYFVGPSTSSAAQALLPYANANGLVMVSPSSSASDLAMPDDGLFRFVPPIHTHAPFIVDYMDDNGKTHVVAVVRDDLWGQDAHRAFVENYDGVIPATIWYDKNIDAVDFTSVAWQIEDAVDDLRDVHTDDIMVLFIGFDADFIRLAKAMVSDDRIYDATRVGWYGYEGIVDYDTVTQDADTAAFAASVNLVGSTFTITVHDGGELAQRLENRFPGIGINTFTYTTYDSVHVLGDAIISSFVEERGVRDLIIEVANRHIQDPLESLRDQHHELGHGITGDFELDENGDLVSPIHYPLYAVTQSDDGSYEWTIVEAGPPERSYMCR